MDNLPNSPYAQYAIAAANKAGVPPEILVGLITAENGQWSPGLANHNKNGTTDFGLTQLNDKYYPETYQMTPYEQIDKSASILAANYKAKGNWYDAVRQYNGSGAVTYGYADGVFANAAKLGYSASDQRTAAATGLPLGTQTPYYSATSSDGSITAEIGTPPTTGVPASGPSGDNGSSPVNSGSTGVDGIKKAIAGFDWANIGMIIAAGLFLLFVTHAVLNQQEPQTIKVAK